MLKVMIAVAVLLGQAAHSETIWLTPDFKLIRTSKIQPPPPGTTDCRAKIAQAVCLVDPPKDKNERPQDRTCLPGGDAYSATFQSIHDRYPQHLQKMFCSLERIFIEKEFFATAYAGVMSDPNGKAIGAIMGVRKSFLDQPLTIDHWSSWKEQLNFGGDPLSYKLNPALPMIHSSEPDMLYFVVAHEFGHIFDFANELNDFDDCKFDADGKVIGTCVAAANSWTELGWKNRSGETTEGNDFAFRKSLCFYWCKGNAINPLQAIDVYMGLFSTNFISVYAASNPFDDFAETLAYHALDRELGASYGITLGDGTHFNAMAHLKSPLLKAKIDYLEDLFQSGRVKYPGQN